MLSLILYDFICRILFSLLRQLLINFSPIKFGGTCHAMIATENVLKVMTNIFVAHVQNFQWNRRLSKINNFSTNLFILYNFLLNIN